MLATRVPAYPRIRDTSGHGWLRHGEDPWVLNRLLLSQIYDSINDKALLRSKQATC